MNRTAQFALLAALLFAGAAVFAADSAKSGKRTVTLKNGKVLEDAYVLDERPNGVTVGYKDGCTFIRFSDMPKNIQDQLGYDPEAAAKYEKKVEDQQKTRQKAAEKQKAKEKSQKTEQNKRARERQIAQQEQTVRKLELQLEEAQKQLDSMESTVSQDRSALVSTLDNSRVSIDTPWGVNRVRTSSNSTVRNKLMNTSPLAV